MSPINPDQGAHKYIILSYWITLNYSVTNLIERQFVVLPGNSGDVVYYFPIWSLGTVVISMTISVNVISIITSGFTQSGITRTAQLTAQDSR